MGRIVLNLTRSMRAGWVVTVPEDQLQFGPVTPGGHSDNSCYRHGRFTLNYLGLYPESPVHTSGEVVSLGVEHPVSNSRNLAVAG